MGSLTITDAGAFTYTVANSAVQFLSASATKNETFTVQSVDGTASQDITVTIKGVNDNPVAGTDSLLAN
ncbi:MAG: VCBS domain-containing protein [Nostoc sp. DedQUE01]